MGPRDLAKSPKLERPVPGPPFSQKANSMADSTQPSRSDKILSNKWDFVVSNGLVKGGVGFGVGVVASVLFFRRRAWPVWLGLGFGAGRAWAEGDAVFRLPATPSSDSGVRQVKA